MANESKAITKMNSAYILHIIEQYGNERTPLLIEDIETHLKTDYNIEVERKSIQDIVRRLLNKFTIDNDENYYMVRPTRKSGVYMKKNSFEESEIRLLIDSIVGNKHIKKRYAQDLITKLAKLTNSPLINSITLGNVNKDENEGYSAGYFANIDAISNAINSKQAISFNYGKYVLVQDNNNMYYFKMMERKEYVVSPYKMIVHNQHYYLMCTEEGKIGLRSFRIDKMEKVHKSDVIYMDYTPSLDYQTVEDLDDLSRLPFMSSGVLVNIGLKINMENDTINQLLDWFSKDDIMIKKVTSKWLYCEVKSNEFAMLKWACLYIDDVVVTSPEPLVTKVEDNINIACRNYGIYQKIPV